MTQEEMLELKAVVRRTMEEQMEMYSEVWLTDEELCKYFGTLKKSWLDRNWQSLPKNCVRQPGWTDEELCKYFGTLKKSWLDRNWQALPKNCVRQPGWTDEKGEEHSTSRLYARNKIQRLFASGEIEHLRCRAVVG